jgi:hypothetical protein
MYEMSQRHPVWVAENHVKPCNSVVCGLKTVLFSGCNQSLAEYFFFGGLECVGHSFAYVAHLRFLRDVWIRTQSAAVASWRATNLATHPSRIFRIVFIAHWI